MHLFYLLPFLLVLLCNPGLSGGDDGGNYDRVFYDACARGDIETVSQYTSDDPNWATRPTPDGETCLHLTSISKSLEISKLMIELSADVNHRTTHNRGLRMTPLSWHVFAGNFDIVRLLVDNGAQINLDFDLDESGKKATVMDISTLLTDSKDSQTDKDDPFVKVHELLINRGGKKYEELSLSKEL